MTVIEVHRRFPFYQSTIRSAASCDVVRAQLHATGDSFVLVRRRRGPFRGLRPRFSGSIASNDGGGCDITVHVAYPPAWWVIDVVLFVMISSEVFRANADERVVLTGCLAALITISVFSLWLAGSIFARRLATLLGENAALRVPDAQQ